MDCMHEPCGAQHAQQLCNGHFFFFNCIFKKILFETKYPLKHYFYVCHSKFALWKYIYRLMSHTTEIKQP